MNIGKWTAGIDWGRGPVLKTVLCQKGGTLPLTNVMHCAAQRYINVVHCAARRHFHYALGHFFGGGALTSVPDENTLTI